MKNRIILMAALMLLSGCWDKTELENRAYVNTIGIDSTRGRFTVTVEFPRLESKKEKTGERFARAETAETVRAAMRKIDGSSDKKMYYGHTEAIVLGSGLFENEGMFRETMDALLRGREVGRNVIMLSSKVDARTIIESETEDIDCLGTFITDYYGNNPPDKPARDLQGLITGLRAGDSALIPEIRLEGGTYRLGGAAVIKGGRLVGWLDDKRVRGCVWITGGAGTSGGGRGMAVTAGVGDSGENETRGTLDVTGSRREISFYDNNGWPVCEISLDIRGSVEEYAFQSEVPELEAGGICCRGEVRSPAISALGSAFETEIEEDIGAAFDWLTANKADALGFGEIMRKRFYGLYMRYIGNWEEAFANMTLQTNIRVDIASVGAVK
ncbi:MAG: Ger(x)C family spore germination protein [Clostridiales bacterium]|nr:Ger(x)C family spore germination protein [Clostridiales bacterium]